MAEENVAKILTAVARLETKLDNVLEVQADQENRIRLLEGRNGKRWDTLTAQAISIIVAALIGLALGKII